MKDIAIYKRCAVHGNSPAPMFKAIIWDEGEKHQLPIAFYGDTEQEAHDKAAIFIAEQQARKQAISDRAAKANAAKKEK